MATVQQTLAIIGAAEGSWYQAGGRSIDVRYAPSFANANSGMSFGTFQFDVATNIVAQTVLSDILNRAKGVKQIDSVTSSRIYAAASMRNAKLQMKPDDVRTVTLLMSARTVLVSSGTGRWKIAN